MTLDNTTGLITGAGTIKGAFVNSGAGELLVDTGQTITVSSAFANSGLILVNGASSWLKGGAIANSGQIEGVGRISNAIANTGQILPGTGALTLYGALTNEAGGSVALGQGSILNLNGSLANQAGASVTIGQGSTLSLTTSTSNAGLISLAGGTLSQSRAQSRSPTPASSPATKS